MKKFFKGLFCFLGAFVLGVGIAVLPYINTYSSYAASPTFDNVSIDNSYANSWYKVDTSFGVLGSGYTFFTDGLRLYKNIDKVGTNSSAPIYKLYYFDSSNPFAEKSMNLKGPSNLSTAPEGTQNIWYSNFDVTNPIFYLSNGSNHYKIYFETFSETVTVAGVSLTSNYGGRIVSVTFNGLTSFSGQQVYNINGVYYYSLGENHYSFDPNTLTWSPVTFNGLTNFNGVRIWNDGSNYFYSNNEEQFILDVDTLTWSPVTFNGLTPVSGAYIFNNGTYTYYVNNLEQYKFDPNTLTWSPYTFYAISDGSKNVSLDGRYFGFYRGITYYYTSSYSANVYYNFSSLYDYGYKLGYTDGYTVGYTDGYTDGSSSTGGSDSYNDGYNNGYNAGYNAGIATNTGYNAGYNSGYNNGYNEGYSKGSSAGYNTGYSEGNREGYNTGYAEGVEDSNEYTFLGLVGAVIDAPIQAFTNLFNFEIFGTNIKNLLLALFTASIIVVVVKFALGGK